MCFSSGGGSTPAPPQLAPPVPPPVTPADPEISKARQRNRARAALAQGRAATIATSGLGLTTPASTALKTALGS